MAERKLILDVLARDHASRPLRAVGNEADRAGRKLDGMAGDASHLDKQIDKVKGTIGDLAVELSKADRGSALFSGLKKEFEGANRELKQLERIAKALPASAAKIGADMAPGVVSGLGGGLARAGASLGPAGAAIGAGLAAGATPLLLAGLGGAVIGAAGAGGVVGGLVLAAKDARVKAEAENLAQSLDSMLQTAAAPFVPAVLGAMQDLRKESAALAPEFRTIFGAAASYVQPLERGLVGMVKGALPGLRDAVVQAGPVIDALADGLIQTGEAVGDLFSTIAEHAPEGARALTYLFEIVEIGIDSLSKMISVGSTAFKWMDIASSAMSGRQAQTAAQYAVAQHNAAAASDRTSSASAQLLEALNRMGGAAEDTTYSVQRLDEAFRNLFDRQMNADQAAIRWQESLAEMNKELRSGARTLSINTAEGRANTKSLLASIEVARRVRDANLARGQSLDLVNAKYASDIEGLRAAAVAAGFNKRQVDALVGAYRRIPDEVVTEIKATGASSAAASARVAAAAYNALPRSIQTTIYTNRMDKGRQNRWGGVYTHAAEGALRQADVFSPVNPARYAFAEPATGGEAFIPRHGDAARSTRILSKAASWYGLAVGRPGMAGGGTVVNYNVQLSAGVVGSQLELQNWLARAMADLQRKGRV